MTSKDWTIHYGQTYNKLTCVPDTIVRRPKGRSSVPFAEFICACGTQKLLQIKSVVSGHTKSCGCLSREHASNMNKKYSVKHGERYSRLYSVWAGMLTRCNNPKATNYRYYGGAGVRVCESWLTYCNFESDMGGDYTEGLEIDRIAGGNSHYCKENCRWVNKIEQQSNKSNNLLITYMGETLTLAKWSRKLGMPYGTLRYRIKKCGWSVTKAFETPTK